MVHLAVGSWRCCASSLGTHTKHGCVSWLNKHTRRTYSDVQHMFVTHHIQTSLLLVVGDVHVVRLQMLVTLMTRFLPAGDSSYTLHTLVVHSIVPLFRYGRQKITAMEVVSFFPRLFVCRLLLLQFHIPLLQAPTSRLSLPVLTVPVAYDKHQAHIPSTEVASCQLPTVSSTAISVFRFICLYTAGSGQADIESSRYHHNRHQDKACTNE